MHAAWPIVHLPSVRAYIKEPARTIEVACFLRYCLLVNTDRLLLMVRRCVADVWRHAADNAKRVLIHWAELYPELLGSMEALVSDATVTDSEVRERVLVNRSQMRSSRTLSFHSDNTLAMCSLP